MYAPVRYPAGAGCVRARVRLGRVVKRNRCDFLLDTPVDQVVDWVAGRVDRDSWGERENR